MTSPITTSSAPVHSHHQLWTLSLLSSRMYSSSLSALKSHGKFLGISFKQFRTVHLTPLDPTKLRSLLAQTSAHHQSHQDLLLPLPQHANQKIDSSATLSFSKQQERIFVKPRLKCWQNYGEKSTQKSQGQVKLFGKEIVLKFPRSTKHP